MARILVGVSGGIAAYKTLELIRLATAAGHSVRVIQTPASRRFVGAASFEALSGAPALAQDADPDPLRGAFPGEQPASHEPIGHLELAAKADLMLIAPASANTIAKLACGMADNLLCSCALAASGALLVAPALNDRMYEHPATQANLQTLRSRGAIVLEPSAGRLASKGEHGVGRMQEPAQLLAACETRLQSAAERPWRGLRVLITAGGTREPIDGVRFVGNSSSGRMGLALAEAARERGAEVTVIMANVSLAQPPGVRLLQAPTAAQMERSCREQLPGCDVLLMAAAVADFRPAEPVAGKIRKGSELGMTLRLEPTIDVLGALAELRRPEQTVVGFAAESGRDALERGREKLQRKRLDAIVVNDVSRGDIGFEAAANEVTILTAEGEQHVAKAPKRAVAEAILNAVAALRGSRAQRLQ